MISAHDPIISDRYQLEYEQQERDKSEAWTNLQNKSLPLEMRQLAMLQLISAHYSRSVSSWRNNRHHAHGSWTQFVCSWLHANGHMGYGEVFAALQRYFPPPEKPMISKGKSYWGS